MQAQNKPRLGVLALMLEGYEPLFPGITARQHAYVEEVVSSLSEAAECVFPRVALSRADIEAIVAGFNAQGLDGILILLLTYSQGQYLVHAMQRNSLPLALALVQPDETVGDDFEELELTVNQGIHGSQDNANCLLRAGIPCVFFAGSRKNGELAAFVRDFGAAARTVEAMRRMRIGVIGRLPGMGDVVTDDMAVYRVLGPEFVYDSIGTVRRLCAEADEKEIARLMALDRERFDVDPHMPPERHAESVRMYLGIRAWLESGGYAGYTLHFDELGADGRFIHLPFLAASNLMAEGYGYAAEGDATCAMLMAAMIRLCGRANFSEMYMMDLAREAILMCHAGHGPHGPKAVPDGPRVRRRRTGQPADADLHPEARARSGDEPCAPGRRPFPPGLRAGRGAGQGGPAALRHALSLLPAAKRRARLREGMAGAGRHAS